MIYIFSAFYAEAKNIIDHYEMCIRDRLKSELEGKAEHYADKLVPWTLGATGLTYLLTRNEIGRAHVCTPVT